MYPNRTYFTLPCNTEAAVYYARRWAYSRNPLFPDYAGLGGDCTNFVSQCVLAGCPLMNRTPTFGWYYTDRENRAPAWTGVDAFYRFLLGDPVFREENGGEGPFGEEVKPAAARVGDIVQLGNGDGVWYHSLLVVGFDGDDPLIAAHTNDALDRPLSSYSFDRSRFLRVLGGRLIADTETIAESLTEGVSFPTLSAVAGKPVLLPQREEFPQMK